MRELPLNATYWQEYLDFRLEKVRSTMSSKGAEYSKATDKLHNFHRAKQASGGRCQTREDAMFGMALKHWVSILDILDGIKDGTLPDRELVKEKFGDMINYLMLEEASVLHRIDTKDGAHADPQFGGGFRPKVSETTLDQALNPDLYKVKSSKLEDGPDGYQAWLNANRGQIPDPITAGAKAAEPETIDGVHRY